MSSSPAVQPSEATPIESHVKEDSENTAVETDPVLSEPKADADPIEEAQPPKDIFTPSTPSEPPFEKEVKPAAPADGEEKHDWEVVNASPSHSPSKDEVNSNVSTKGKGKEKEKSAAGTGTFSKDGKIGQKIDGVRKVLKSGVFGTSSPKTEPTSRARVSTKPPVPSTRGAVPKPAPSASVASKATAATAAKPARTPITTTRAPITAATRTRPDTTLNSSVSSSTVRPLPASDSTSTIRPRPTTAGPRSSLAAGAKPTSTATARVPSNEAKTSSALARRASLISNASNASAKSASMPVTAKAPVARGSMGPPTSASAKSMPARGSVGPGSFVAASKATEELKTKVADLEKQLAGKTKEQEERVAQIDKEREEMAQSHAQALESLQRRVSLQEQIREAEDQVKSQLEQAKSQLEQAKSQLEQQVAYLKLLHEQELQATDAQRSALSAELTAKIEEMTATHARLETELEASRATITLHQSSVDEAKHAHESATTALADLRAARESDEGVISDLKRELLAKEHLLSQAMADLQKTSQIESELRNREEEIEKVRAAHQDEVNALREAASGSESSREAHETEVKRLQHQLNDLSEENEKTTKKLSAMQDLVEKRDEEVQAARTALRVAERTSLEHQATISSLQEKLSTSESKHDELLIETAGMSDTRIAELSEQLEHAESLKNEAIAELEHERAGSLDAKNREEQLTARAEKALASAKEQQEVVENLKVELAQMRQVNEQLEKSSQKTEKLDKALADMKAELAEVKEVNGKLEVADQSTRDLEQELGTTKAELVKVKQESDQKYASAFEEARALASQENVQDLIILREELTVTHTELVEAHQAEIDSLHNKHSVVLADLAAEHHLHLGEVSGTLQEAHTAVSGAIEEKEELEEKISAAAAESEELRVKLEAALHQAGGVESESKAELEEAVRKASELEKQLEEVKEKHEADQLKLRSSMEGLQDEHNTTLRQHAGHAAGKMEAMRSEHAEEVAKLKQQVESLRGMLNAEIASKLDIQDQVKALRQHRDDTPKQADFSPKTPRAPKVAATPSTGESSSHTGWDFETESANSSYMTARADESRIVDEGTSESDSSRSHHEFSSSADESQDSNETADTSPDRSHRRYQGLQIMLAQQRHQPGNQLPPVFFTDNESSDGHGGPSTMHAHAVAPAGAENLTGGFISSGEEPVVSGQSANLPLGEGSGSITTPSGKPGAIPDASATPTGSSFLSDDDTTPSVQTRALPAEADDWEDGSPKPRNAGKGKEVQNEDEDEDEDEDLESVA